MKTLRVTIFLLFAVVSWNTDAQERIVDRSFNIWMSTNLRYNLHPRWYLNSEIHIRRANGFSNWQQFVARPSVHFVLSKYADFSVGYSYILSYPYGNQPIPLTTPEHNIWEQAILAHKMGKVGFKHRYRFEQRFQGVRKQDGEGIYSIDGFELAERFRYRLTLIVPVALEGRWFVSLFDEVFVRQSNFVPSAFDQNWAYLGVGFKLNTRGTIKLGYLDAFIRKSDGVHFEHNPTVQFSIGYKLGKLPESVN